jgi:beta-lactamase class D
MTRLASRTWFQIVAGILTTVCACSSPRPADPAGALSANEREIDLSASFPGIGADDATFVVLNASSGEVLRHNRVRAQRRLLPASTFKIPNSLIALETGVASGPDHLIPWDSVLPTDGTFWASSWSRDHTLRSAMQNSVFWYYQTVAREIGADRMQRYLDQFDYGNRNMGGGLDGFWLHGDLRISPDEQVRFLQRMYNGELGVSERSTQIVKDMLLLESTDAYRLSGKTGTANLTATRELAWLVGYVERPSETWFFALNVEGEEVWERWGNPSTRLRLLRQLLSAVGAIQV